jgi:hypothetical protein
MKLGAVAVANQTTVPDCQRVTALQRAPQFVAQQLF